TAASVRQRAETFQGVGSKKESYSDHFHFLHLFLLSHPKSLTTSQNGALLTETEKSGFSVLITSDKGIKAQQTMTGRLIAVVIIRAPNNRLETHVAMIPEIAQVLAAIQPGQIIEVFHPDMNP